MAKNLLQEYLQKRGLALPIYETMPHPYGNSILWQSSVHLYDGRSFTGSSSANKVTAELSAAQIAYNTLTGQQASELSTARTTYEARVTEPSDRRTPEDRSYVLQRTVGQFVVQSRYDHGVFLSVLRPMPTLDPPQRTNHGAFRVLPRSFRPQPRPAHTSTRKIGSCWWSIRRICTSSLRRPRQPSRAA